VPRSFVSEIVSSAYVPVENGGFVFLGRAEVKTLLVEPLLQHRFDAALGVGVDGQGSRRRCLEAHVGVVFAEMDDPHAGSIAVLRVGAFAENRLD